MSVRSRRSFLGLLLRAAGAVLAGPTILARAVRAASSPQITAGSSIASASVWAGRGCSAIASAISAVGGAPSAPYEVDFTSALGVVVSGVAADGLIVAGSTVTADPGGSWALLTVPSASATVTLDLGPNALSVSPEGT
jgi:hypothetical protein